MIQYDPLPDQDADQITPVASTCPLPVRTMKRRAHRNCGHPRIHYLVRLMTTTRCQDVAIEHVRCVNCPMGMRRKPPPRIPRASIPYRPTSFNHIVGLGLEFVKDNQGRQHSVLNILDTSTMYNIIALCDSTAPAVVANTLKGNGVQWAGPPRT